MVISMVGMASNSKIYVILPAYNEGGNLSSLFESFKELPEINRYRFFLINDGSTDNTLEVLGRVDAKIDLKIINNQTNLGLSKTLLKGLQAVLQVAELDDYVVFMDGDNTHLPSQVPELIIKLESGCDIAIASRYQIGATIDGLSEIRRAFSYFASLLFQLLIPVRNVRDFSSGFRAIKSSLLKRLSTGELTQIFSTRGFACTTGLLLALTRDASIRVEEIPMTLKYNQKAGISKMNLRQTSVESLKLIVSEWLVRHSGK